MGIGAAYVWCVVVEAQVVVYNRVVCMVCFDQVLQGPRALLSCGLNVVDLNRWEDDCLVIPTPSCEERRQRDSG